MANTSVYGIYKDKEQTVKATDTFRRAGYRTTDISSFLAANQGNKDLAHRKDTKAPEGIALGVAAGVLVGIAFGWLVGNGNLTIQWFHPYLTAGALMVALAGAGAGAIVGGILGALCGLSMPEYVVRRYRGRVRDSGILLSVHCDSSEWVSRARGIFEATGAGAIASAAEAPADFLKTDKPLQRRFA